VLTAAGARQAQEWLSRTKPRRRHGDPERRPGLTVRDACSAHDHPTVITHNYGQAGAIEACTEVPVWSGHMSFYNRGPPPGPGNVPLVGFDNPPFDDCEVVAKHHNPVENEEDDTEIKLCTAPTEPWQTL
jgi:hypothetical protein